MNVIWIILAVLSFVGGQVYLFIRLCQFDRFLERKPNKEQDLGYDDSCGYPDKDVIE